MWRPSLRAPLLLLMLVGAAASGLPAIRLKQLPSKERIFVDELGRQRLFHGVNAVVKGPPWVPTRNGLDYNTSLAKEDFELMQAAGVNQLRLGVMWAGAEPTRGTYNESYFAEIKAIIDEAARHGIYTLADMHQDALSERFCGEGVPPWAAQTKGTLLSFPEPFLSAFTNGPDGFPTRQDCDRLDAKLGMNGQGGAGTEAAGGAYENLFTNVDGLTDAWGMFFAKILDVTKDSSSSILGLNLINEPFAGDVWHNPFRALPFEANKILQGAYDIVASHIRKVSDDVLIFFPGVTWSDLEGFEVNNGFTHPPGGANYANRSVLSFHYYVPPNDKNVKEYVEKAIIPNVRRLQTGTFLTETFGVHEDQPWHNIVPEVESRSISWSYWEWKSFCTETEESKKGTSQYAAWGSCITGVGGSIFNDTGVRAENLRILGRMYAYAVQGVLTAHAYNETAPALAFSYDLDPGVGAPTEVYANPEWHGGPGGEFSVVVSPSNMVEVEVKPAARSIHIKALPSARPGRVSVAIRPAPKKPIARRPAMGRAAEAEMVVV